MSRDKTLVIVLAGGAGSRLAPLTDERAKPAVPFAGTYRLVDFPLSNCMHSGLSDVWVIEQQNPVSLAAHLSNGRPWDLDRTYGGLLVLHPHLGDERGGFHQGTADALWRNEGLIREFGAESLVVVSADAIYRLDYAAVVAEHRETGADVTMVTTEVDPQDAPRYGIVRCDGDRVVDYAYKPDEPATDLATNEVFVFRAQRALDVLAELGRDADPEEGMGDLGDGLLPRLVADGGARQHPLAGYWRDVGTHQAYWQAHMDLLEDPAPLRLDDPSWQILSRPTQRMPARVEGSAEVDRALLSPGAVVRGRVERSVLAPGVVVEEGAVVRDSVLLHDVRVEAGAVVERAVLDEAAVVGRGGRVAGGDALEVLGRGARVQGE
ncbi:MAG: sugar phosphate nucleotidyltransferase [Actinomycetota bacterium]|nr:sugar phosphate nucleotidyltransferase [Actinomycetota bacterium]